MVTARKKSSQGAQLRHVSEVFALPSTGSCRVALISDTHSKAHKDAVKHVKAQNPDLILHGGDIGDLAVLAPFKKLAPLHFVRGNIDPHAPELADSIDISFESAGKPVFRLLLTHIAVYGPKLRADARALAKAHNCTMVVCGHSHVPFIGTDRGVSMINPGSIGPRRFNLPITFGVLDVSPQRLEARHISCETGEVWLP